MKKGFTLIELLAVVIVLAVIALIAIPRTMNIIRDSQNRSAHASSIGILEAANIYYSNKSIEGKVIDSELIIDFNNKSTIPDGFDFSGKYPDRGKIAIKPTGEVYIYDYLEYNNSFCIMKELSFTEIECGKDGLGTQIVMNYDNVSGRYYVDGFTSQMVANNNNKLTYDSWSTPISNTTFWDNVHNISTQKATPLEDGWVKFEWDRTNLALSYLNLFSKRAAVDLLPDTQYTLILEVRNVNITDNGAFYIARTAASDTTFTSAFTVSTAELNSKTVIKKLLTTSSSAVMASSTHGLRTFKTLPAGSKGSFEARLMIVLGDYTSTDIEYELYGKRPSPTYESKLKNLYSQGMYTAKTSNKSYMFYLEEDLKSVPNGASDRLWIDASTNEISITRNIGVSSFNGTESWSTVLNNSSNSLCCYMSRNSFSLLFEQYPINNSAIYSNYLPYTNLGQSSYRNRIGDSIYGYGDASAAFMITQQVSLTNAGWKEWLDSNPLTMYYQLAVPTEEQVERK